MAVWNVSMKKSVAATTRSPVALRQDDGRARGEEHRRPVGRRVGVGARAADRAPVADLRIADPAGRVDEERVARPDRRVFEDLAMGGPAADPEVVVGLDDPVEPVDVADVDEEAGLGQTQLEQRQEAVAAGQDLGLALAFGQDPQRVVETGWSDVVELTRDHPSSSRPIGTLTLGAEAASRLAVRHSDDTPGAAQGFQARPRDPGAALRVVRRA